MRITDDQPLPNEGLLHLKIIKQLRYGSHTFFRTVDIYYRDGRVIGAIFLETRFHGPGCPGNIFAFANILDYRIRPMYCLLLNAIRVAAEPSFFQRVYSDLRPNLRDTFFQITADLATEFFTCYAVPRPACVFQTSRWKADLYLRSTRTLFFVLKSSKT